MSIDIVNIVNSIVIIHQWSTRLSINFSRERDIKTNFIQDDIKAIFFVEFNSYSIEWILNSDSFVFVARKFHAIIVQYKLIRIYFNFLSIIISLSNSNDNISSRNRNKFFDTQQQSLSSIIDRKSFSIISRRLNSFFLSLNASRSDKFNDSKSHVRWSISLISFLINATSFIEVISIHSFFARRVDNFVIDSNQSANIVSNSIDTIIIDSNSLNNTRQINEINVEKIIHNQFIDSNLFSINNYSMNDKLNFIIQIAINVAVVIVVKQIVVQFHRQQQQSSSNDEIKNDDYVEKTKNKRNYKLIDNSIFSKRRIFRF